MSKFLPNLSEENAPDPQDRPSWHDHDGQWTALLDYATALNVASESVVQPERIKSVPSPWARVLLFDHALRQRSHPAHDALTAEWRGLLGCIALAERLHLTIRVTPANIDQARAPVEILSALAPGGNPDGRWNRWGIIEVNGQIVGGTSPRTLVFTGFRSTEITVPFQTGGRLTDPGQYFVNRAHQDLPMARVLLRWIRGTEDKLRRHLAEIERFVGAEVPGETPAAALVREFDKWANEEYWPAAIRAQSAGEPPIERGLGASPFEGIFPADHPGQILVQLRTLPPIEGGSSDLALKPELASHDGGLVVDPGPTGILVKDGRPLNGTIDLPGRRGVPVTDGRIEPGVTKAQLGPDPIDLSEFFGKRLIQVTDVSAEGYALSVGGKSFLLPFDRGVLEHLSDGTLIRHVTATSEQDAITVQLEVQVQSLLSVRYERRYEPSDQILSYDSPELVQWPDFAGESWNHYFFYTRQVDPENSLHLEPANDVDVEVERSADGTRQWGLCHDPITAWRGAAGQYAGLLMVPTQAPEPQAEDNGWDISIDFGSTHTRVFKRSVDENNRPVASPLALQERARTVLGHGGDLPGNFFLDPAHPMQNPEEPRSMVRVPPGVSKSTATWLPSHGTIYFDSIQHTALDGLRTNLKWHDPGSQDDSAFQAYIHHLVLSVAAEATARGARIDRILTAFPSVFPHHLRTNHRDQWEELKSIPFLEIRVPEAVRESTALAAYLVENHQVPQTANLIAVDVGGSTADFAVRYNDHYHGDSVRFAGQLVVSAAANTKAGQEAIRRALSAPPLREHVGDDVRDRWGNGSDGERALLFNALLRLADRLDIGGSRLAGALYQGPGSPGEELIAYAAFLYATLAYYAGIMVRHQRLQRHVYYFRFAGRGTGFIPWLDELHPGASRTLPESFFNAGRDDHDGKVDIEWSREDAKWEVGAGLLFAKPESEQLPRHHETLVGENGFELQGRPVQWNDALTTPELAKIRRPDSPEALPRLEMLERFLSTFRKTDAGQAVVRALGLPGDANDADLKNHLYHALFGDSSPWRSAQEQQNEDHLVVEPILITEIKAVLRHATGLKFRGM